MCYWCVEYYGLCGVSNFVLEVMIVCVVSVMKYLCVGFGGVMLFYYSFFKLVEQFCLLEVLFFNCIDLGVGCVFGGDMCIVQVVVMGDYNCGDIFLQQVQELIWYLIGMLLLDYLVVGVLF